MPNGETKNWIRLCAAIDGFRARYGRWPTRVRLFDGALRNLESLFLPEDFRQLTDRVALVPDDAPMIAEDDSGACYNYGKEDFPGSTGVIRAYDWLGVSPRPEFD